MSTGGNVTIQEAPTTGLGRLITENRFFVPTHQRDYKWDRDRVERFVDDLMEAKDRGDEFYFIGLMVFMRSEDGKLRVLDGQQRLATSIVIYSALRAWAGASGDNEMMSRLQYDFIGRAEYGEPHPEPKLTLNLNNDDFFQKYVTVGGPIEAVRVELKRTGKNESNYSLLDAVSYCHQRLSEKSVELANNSTAKAYFSGLIKFMRDSVIVVRLTVPNESNAFRVFETLNDRGMDLSAVDLLKNYLFGCVYNISSPARLKQMEHRWSQLTGTLQNLRHEDFLKVYWTSRHGLVLLDDIFDEVKKIYKTAQEAEKVSIDLHNAAVHYAALDEPDDVVWSECTENTRSLIRNLRILGSKLVRPVILSGFEKLAPAQFEKLLWVLEVIIVRWQVIGEGRTGTIERTCARLAQQIWDGKVTNRKGAIQALNELYLEDKEFQNKFSTQQGVAGQKAVYLLKKIEDAERLAKKGQAGKELSPHKSLTLEHVLPNNPAQDWATVLKQDPKIVDECSARLGNLCLLTEAMNREVGRAGYGKKKKIYEASELLTTREAGTYAAWNRKSIEHRQIWLASKATSIWRLD